MEYFDYQVVDESNNKILRVDGLPLVVISIAAMNVMKAQEQLSQTPNNTKFIDYAAMTRRIVKDILQGKVFADQQDIIAPVLTKVLNAIDVGVNESKTSDDHGNHIGAVNNFYQSLTITLTDSIEVLKDEYKPTSETDSTMRHEGWVKMISDGNEWVFKIVNLSPDGSPYEVSINGMDIESISDTDKISSDGRWHAFLLSSLALQMVHGMQAAHRVNSMLGHPDVVRKSKGIAKVMGGNYEDYLYAVGEFDAAIKRSLASGDITEEDIDEDYMTKSIIKHNPNTTDAQAKEIVALFKSKPIYH